MSQFVIGIFVGCFLGCFLGSIITVFTMALFIAGRDERTEEVEAISREELGICEEE